MFDAVATCEICAPIAHAGGPSCYLDGALDACTIDLDIEFLAPERGTYSLWVDFGSTASTTSHSPSRRVYLARGSFFILHFGSLPRASPAKRTEMGVEILDALNTTPGYPSTPVRARNSLHRMSVTRPEETMELVGFDAYFGDSRAVAGQHLVFDTPGRHPELPLEFQLRCCIQALSIREYLGRVRNSQRWQRHLIVALHHSAVQRVDWIFYLAGHRPGMWLARRLADFEIAFFRAHEYEDSLSSFSRALLEFCMLSQGDIQIVNATGALAWSGIAELGSDARALSKRLGELLDAHGERVRATVEASAAILALLLGV